MLIEVSDLHLLSEGKPPKSEELLSKMTVGRELWLNYVRSRYLQNYIAKGGSKVKVLIGSRGSGKTHLLKALLADAGKLGYRTVLVSARQCRLSNTPSLYQEVAQHIVGEDLIRGLCRQIAKQIDETAEYDGASVFTPYVYNKFPTPKMAESKIQEHIGKFFRDIDLDACFKAFGYGVANNRMINQSPENIEIACD
jgi:Cdc6-like AAA superfamily ATPase